MHIYTIDLNPSQEQETSVWETFQPTKVTIYKAFDARSMDMGQCKKKSNHPLWRGHMRGGEFGCAKSHHEVWRKIMLGSDNCALILEEDWRTTDYFNIEQLKCLEQFIRKQKEPSLVYLGWNSVNIKPFNYFSRIKWGVIELRHRLFKKTAPWHKELSYNIAHLGISKKIVRPNSPLLELMTSGLPHGTFGYMINPPCARVLYAFNEDLMYRSDETLNMTEMGQQVRMYRTLNPLITWEKGRPSTTKF